MDYKYIEQLLERYFAAETTFEEESILRTFFRQEQLPPELAQWKAMFVAATDEALGDDFDARILQMTVGDDSRDNTVQARRVSLTQRLVPLYKAAAIVAIIVSLGGALQAPWDNSLNTPDDYAALQQQIDTICVTPIQAENIGCNSADSDNKE